MRGFVLIASLFLSQFLFSQTHWESIVLESDEWKYLVATSEPDTNWYQSDFNDSTWTSGIGGIGYGDGDDATIVSNVSSLYLRKKVIIEDISAIETLLIDIDYDDAFVLFLNGTEVARSFNIINATLTYDAPLTMDHEASLYSGGTPERIPLDVSVLSQGENTLAVQIINRGVNSSDLSARVFLNAEINDTVIVYNETPDWFSKPVNFDESNLPIILINTQGQSIPDEPKITALMKVINNSNGVNNINDTDYEYDGFIGIETRGNTSQLFYDKKSFALETRTVADSNLNVSLLGLPEENDWVLYGPYSDKSLMRNVMAYHLGNKMGDWSPRTRYCEVYINEEYRGIYVFMEKIKIDKNRVDIARLKPTDNHGDELSGGYILSIDRVNEGSWVSPYLGRTGTSEEPLTYVDPKYDELTPFQRDYIKDYVTAFEYTLASDYYADPEKGYRAFIDVTSFADMFIMTELARDLDGYRCSVFFHKDKDSKGGKLNMSPFWDFNLCFGNGNFMMADNPEGWVVEGIGRGDGFESIFWWNRLLQDPYFVDVLKERWNYLRSTSFSNENVFTTIDSCAVLLDEAQQRNYLKFDILNSSVWPNPYIGGSYENEVAYLKQWFTNRFAWMDQNIPTISRDYMDIVMRNGVEVDIDQLLANITVIEENTTSIMTPNTVNTLVYPNPFTDNITFGYTVSQKSNVQIVIQNVLGEKIVVKNAEGVIGSQNIVFSDVDFSSNAGIYIYSILVNGNIVSSGKLLKK